jgi:rubrerythrin
MPSLKGSSTERNLTFAAETENSKRHRGLARQAVAAGHRGLAALLHASGRGETRHAQGHLERLEAPGNPATGRTAGNVAAAIAGTIRPADCPGMARTAREEGFEEIADWFADLAKDARTHHRVRLT